jgi:hypothetical protein
MSILISYGLWLAAAASGTDAVTDCRTAHSADPPAHIACLEAALRELDQRTVAEDAEDLGAEQVREAEEARAATPVQVSVRITSVVYDAEGKGVFRMENGQVWRESEVSPESRRLKPGVQYAGRIERSKLGGYRLYVDGVRRMFKIKRLE